MIDTDVAIIGAGPNGLSLAAHLGHKGVDTRIFGPPMDTWRNHMPADMVMKSDGVASNLSAPGGAWTLGEYCRQEGIAYADRRDWPRTSLAQFVQYGLAFQEQFAPELDHRFVTELDQTDGGFSLSFDDGDRVTAKRVVLAVGITHFAFVPPEFRGLGDHVTAAGEHRTFERFAGRRVAVIGAGSSAVGVTASLLDAGADVQLLARGTEIRFWPSPGPDVPPTPSSSPLRRLRSRLRPLRARLRTLSNPPTGLGPGWRNKLCEDLPGGFRYLPSDVRLRVVARHLGPESPWWLTDKVMGGANVMLQTSVSDARTDGQGVTLTTVRADGTRAELKVDHVICGTGYRVDIDRLGFLDSDIRSSLRRIGAMPALSQHFESSVPGLYFAGIAAAGTFGPLMRFVVGTQFAAPRMAAHLAKGSGRRKERTTTSLSVR